MLARWLQRQWFAQRRLTPALWLLLPVFLPLNLLFIVLAWLKRRTTARQHLPRPVVVIGNITVGGAGKTPLTIALTQALIARGHRPGVVSRGYGGNLSGPSAVDETLGAAVVGDEPLLIARRTGVPVWVGRDRARAAQCMLAAHPEITVILCDDGLQHYRLARDVEIAVFDGRGAGNGWRLPLGPLRESLQRLESVDAIVAHGAEDARLLRSTPKFAMKLQPGRFYRLNSPEICCFADSLRGKQLAAIAGIGDPGRFFATLQQLGLTFSAHPFPDHHAYSAEDLSSLAPSIVLMTEKDAVKCSALPVGEAWVLPIEAELDPAFIDLVLEKIHGRPVA